MGTSKHSNPCTCRVTAHLGSEGCNHDALHYQQELLAVKCWGIVLFKRAAAKHASVLIPCFVCVMANTLALSLL